MLQAQPVYGERSPKVTIFTPGERPVENLALALASVLSSDPQVSPIARVRQIETDLRQRGSGGDCDGLRLFAKTMPAPDAAPLVVVVDQFEEIYTLCRDGAEHYSV